MEKNLHAALTIRLYKEEKCFGPGIAELLEKVQEHHSLRAAAQAMDMAYSKAWTMVKNCEAGLGMKLLNYSTGGKNGGGAELTQEAQAMVEAYRRYCTAVRQQADTLFSECFAQFLQE